MEKYADKKSSGSGMKNILRHKKNCKKHIKIIDSKHK